MEYTFEFENQKYIIKETKEVHGAIEVPVIIIKPNNDSKTPS